MSENPIIYVFTRRKSQMEPVTGYEGPEIEGKPLGDFVCQNCKYFTTRSHSCAEEHMVAHSERPRVADSNQPIVDPLGCCSFVRRTGKYFGGRRVNKS